MPRAVFGRGHRFLPQAQLLHFDEIERLVRRLAPMGVRKLRLTGGEPLLRHDVETLISRLVSIPGIEDLSLTSNGVLLDRARA
jgi:GTP 3',8-cyclase